MDVSSFSFELLPFAHPDREGWTGQIGGYGIVTVHHELTKSRKERTGQARLYGDGFPDGLFRGLGPGKPSLDEPYMFIGGERVEVTYNARGLRPRDRALRLTQGERGYTYTSLGFGKSAELRRADVRVSVGPGRRVEEPTSGFVCAGEVSGPADATDLAFALLFEAVDTASLTLGGALVSAPLNFLQRRPDGGVV
ncbi:hypothetical protein OYE22_20120 [Streptomyces sp. 71268]|uniref:hypothetical protein n=1 Tax=Streptomyces sp. 71268 TaxID=3002640 RepID=UPI0023F73E21|nr:hypothetical protein [Streptomyces sp. 71268]WEV27249.1 hypothetical protein OYE22_20120 [Streptomyces sp. 71268]